MKIKIKKFRVKFGDGYQEFTTMVLEVKQREKVYVRRHKK